MPRKKAAREWMSARVEAMQIAQVKQVKQAE